MILPPGQPPSGRQTLSPAELWQPDGTTACLSGSSGEAMMALLNALATRGNRPKSILSREWSFLKRKSRTTSAPDLLNLAGLAGLYVSEKKDPRMRRLDAAFHIGGPGLSTELGLSLCDFVARMVLEATDITLPFTFAV